MNPRGVVSRQRGMEGLWPPQGGPWSTTQEDSATLRIPYLPGEKNRHRLRSDTAPS